MRSSMFSADRLKNGPLAHLPMANVGELLRRIEAVTVRAKDVVVREGDEGDYYYILDNGRARVTRHVAVSICRSQTCMKGMCLARRH